MKCIFILIIFFHSVGAASYAKGELPDSLPPTIIIPASDFLNEIPKGNIITDAAAVDAEWLFNNTGMVLKSETNLMVTIQVSEPGKYFLFVRSHGEKNSSFKITENDPAHHMFDFAGKRSRTDAVVWFKSTKYSNKDNKKDSNYLKSSVVNHTHY